jgi:hypothetical protein
LYGIFVDTPHDQAKRAVEFWGAALGVTPVPGGVDDPFTDFPGATTVAFEVQGVDDTPRYHLDIETDDVAAETARLMGLGATEEARPDGWVVLRAPGGHLVCVVAVQSSPEAFAAGARTWT